MSRRDRNENFFFIFTQTQTHTQAPEKQIIQEPPLSYRHQWVQEC